ncbi:hypothetical protein EV363DRAFT_1299778 [Boletus edulis]|nr:hypothetical protein EV363DRAFT_1299778 [Boletus edulis]
MSSWMRGAHAADDDTIQRQQCKGDRPKSSTTTKKSTKVAETLLLDERPSGEGRLEESVARKTKPEQQAHKAIIGYARVDVITMKTEFKFGQWNPRRLVDGQSYMPETDSTKDLPLLQLEDAAKGKQRLVAAGRQHCVHVVGEWVKFLCKRHAELLREHKHLEQQDSEAVTSAEIMKENNVWKVKRDAIEETLALGGQWMVILYDAGKINDSLGLHLAENESDHIYRQTPEEALATHVQNDERVKGAPRKCSELLSQEYVWEMLEWLEPMGIHMFNDRKEMKLNMFRDMMLGTGGGLIAQMVMQTEVYACGCFNDIEVDEKKVDELIATATNNLGKEAKQACHEIRAIHRQLLDAAANMKGAMGAGFEIQQRHIDGTRLVEELPSVISTILTPEFSEQPEDSDDQADMRSLTQCVVKVKILRYMLSTSKLEESFGMVPFMSRSVYTQMFCRWWESLIDMVPALGKNWTPGSASAAMIIYIVWNNYRSFLNMEKQLKKLLSTFGVTTQGTETKELHWAQDETSGVAANKKKNAPTRKAAGKGKGNERLSKKQKGKMKRECTITTATDDDNEADNSPFLNSNTDSDGDGDDDENMKEEKAKIRHKKMMEKHTDLIVRHEEWEETRKLLIESKPDVQEKHFHSSLEEIELSHLLRSTQTTLSRGLALMDWTTWEWKDISRSLFGQQILGGVATIRIRSQDAVVAYLVPKDPRQTAELYQSSLKDLFGSMSKRSKEGTATVLMEGRLPPKGCITWPDGIYPTVPENGIALHVVETELVRLAQERSLGDQQRSLQKAINGIQKLPMALHDPTGKAQQRDNPPLNKNVALVLHSLVQVKATRTVPLDPAEALVPNERLHILIRSDLPGDDDDNHDHDHDNTVFLVGAPKMFSLQEIPTKLGLIQHLEDVCRKYEKWVKTHSETDAAMVVDDQEQEKGEMDGSDGDGDGGGEGGNIDGDDGSSVDASEQPDDGQEGQEDACTATDADGSLTEGPPESVCGSEEECDKPNVDHKNHDNDPILFTDLPVNSDGEFLSSSDAPPPNQLAARSIPVGGSFSRTSSTSTRHIPYLAFEWGAQVRDMPTFLYISDTHTISHLDGVTKCEIRQHLTKPATRVSKPHEPLIHRPRPSPALEELKETEELDVDQQVEHTLLDSYTTINDNDSNADAAASTGLIPTQILSSPPRAPSRALKPSRKRDCALTMSSTSSKDGKDTAQKALPKHEIKRPKASNISSTPVASSSVVSSAPRTAKHNSHSASQRAASSSSRASPIDESTYIA